MIRLSAANTDFNASDNCSRSPEMGENLSLEKVYAVSMISRHCFWMPIDKVFQQHALEPNPIGNRLRQHNMPICSRWLNGIQQFEPIAKSVNFVFSRSFTICGRTVFAGLHNRDLSAAVRLVCIAVLKLPRQDMDRKSRRSRFGVRRLHRLENSIAAVRPAVWQGGWISPTVLLRPVRP